MLFQIALLGEALVSEFSNMRPHFSVYPAVNNQIPGLLELLPTSAVKAHKHSARPLGLRIVGFLGLVKKAVFLKPLFLVFQTSIGMLFLLCGRILRRVSEKFEFKSLRTSDSFLLTIGEG